MADIPPKQRSPIVTLTQH